MKRLICAPEVLASQMVLTIITDEQLEAFADAVITKYQQNIVRRKASEPSPEEWMTRKEVMALLKRCDSTMTKWARRGYLVPSMVDKPVLFEQDYIMEKSGHTLGSTVDLTLFDMTTEKEVLQPGRKKVIKCDHIWGIQPMLCRVFGNQYLTKSEAEGRPRGSGGLGPQSIEDIRHKKRQRQSCLFSCLGRELNNRWLSCILGGYRRICLSSG